MLSPADAALVQRDPHLPGLALLLDPAAMLETLQRQVEPVQIEAMQPTYLRYKPGTSCLAAYRV
nr:aminoglycoside phosphotransferase family protein [Anaerolineae bacterium]